MQKQEIIITLEHKAELNKTIQHKYIFNIDKDGERTLHSYCYSSSFNSICIVEGLLTGFFS